MLRSARQFLVWFLVYTLLVILWGAWVRISHSGDGCGTHWPLCHGEFIPDGYGKKTWVEFTHRLMSGLYGLIVFGFFVWVMKKIENHHPLRFWTKLTLFFTVTEALLGAKLVLFGLVGSNDTPMRAFSMALHLMNSLMLTGSITMMISRAKEMTTEFHTSLSQPRSPYVQRLLWVTCFFFVFIGLTGTVAALSNTLYPTGHILEALRDDLNPDSHYLVRLRGLHPLLGISLGIGLMIAFFLSDQNQKRAKVASWLFGTTVALGILMLLLKSPLALKLGHLALAHATWISVVYFFANPEEPSSSSSSS